VSQARINWEGCGRKGFWHKNGGTDGGGLLISPDGVAPTWIVGCVCLFKRLHSTIKTRRIFLLALAKPSGPGKRAVKQL